MFTAWTKGNPSNLSHAAKSRERMQQTYGLWTVLPSEPWTPVHCPEQGCWGTDNLPTNQNLTHRPEDLDSNWCRGFDTVNIFSLGACSLWEKMSVCWALPQVKTNKYFPLPFGKVLTGGLVTHGHGLSIELGVSSTFLLLFVALSPTLIRRGIPEVCNPPKEPHFA